MAYYIELGYQLCFCPDHPDHRVKTRVCWHFCPDHIPDQPLTTPDQDPLAHKKEVGTAGGINQDQGTAHWLAVPEDLGLIECPRGADHYYNHIP